MAGFDSTVASTVTKRIYDSKDTVSQLQDQAPYIKQLKKVPANLGESLYGSIQTGRNQSIGIRNSGSSDNEALPSITAPTFQTPNWDTVRKYVRIYMTGKGESRTRDDKRAFASGVAFKVADANKAYWRDQEFSAFNGSTASGNKTGCRGVLNGDGYSAGSAVTFTLDVTATTPTYRRYQKCKGLAAGMRIEVYEDTTWSKVATIVVASTNPSANTFIGSLDNPIPATANEYYLFREGDFNKDISGLLDIVDDSTLTSTLAGLSTAGLWKGNVLGNSGTLRDLTVSLLDEAELLSVEENDQEASQMWMNFQVYRKLLELHQRTVVLQKGMGGQALKANLGGMVETWNTATIKKSSLCPSNTIFVLQSSDIVLLEQEAYKPLAFGQENGREAFWRFVPGYDAWEAVFVHEFQQKCHRRNLHVQIADITQA